MNFNFKLAPFTPTYSFIVPAKVLQHSITVLFLLFLQDICVYFSYFKKHKTFSEGVKFNPPSAEAAGQFSLSQYRDLTTKDEQTEQLRQCGLTDDEIQYKLEADGLQVGRQGSTLTGSCGYRGSIMSGWED